MSAQPFQRLELPHADVRYVPEFLSAGGADALFAELREQLAWRQDRIRLFGRVHDLPRLQAWHGDPDALYAYSGIVLEPAPWTEALSALRARLERELPCLMSAAPGSGSDSSGARFNSVLANLYRDGRDSNGWHADDEASLGPRPLIASVSLGATRRFRLRRSASSTGGSGARHEPVALDLHHGSLLIMAGDTQRMWQHQVPKTARCVGERINLTWRQITRAGSRHPPRVPRA